MHNTLVDLNLFKVAAALYRTRNVSKAAQELALSQSAVSHALARLRDHFRDPMFVRTSKGVAPTEFARAVQNDILDLISRADLISNKKTRFDPAEVRAQITLATTDYFECLVMPKLLPILEKEAPGLQISLRPTVGELPKKELEEGRFDVAIAGFYRKLPEGFYQSKLYGDTFKCALGKQHSSIKGRLNAEEYFKARHALITLQGDFQDQVTYKVGKSKHERNIVYGSYSFTGLAWVLESSDMILTAPHLLLKRYQEFFPIQVVDCPIDLGSIDIRMIWHMQTHQDPVRKWFRAKLTSICSDLLGNNSVPVMHKTNS